MLFPVQLDAMSIFMVKVKLDQVVPTKVTVKSEKLPRRGCWGVSFTSLYLVVRSHAVSAF